MIHSVIFSFKADINDDARAAFFRAADALREIDGVQKFVILRQTSSKNPFDFGISMEFDGEDDYARYNSDPLHVSFLQNHWIPKVKDFLEIDYQPFQSMR